MPKPKKVTVPNILENADVPIGRDLQVTVEGESDDNNAGRQTSLFVRVFYRVDGVPFAQVLLNGRATDNAGGVQGRFSTDPAIPPKFRPGAAGDHTIRVLAWDHRNRPGHGTDHRSKLVRVKAK